MWSRQLLEPTNPIEFWTMALTIATVGLAAVAGFGLRSLRQAKIDLLTRSQREARACAITRCEDMAHKFIPTNSDLITRFAELKKPVFVQSLDEVRFDTDVFAQLTRASAWFSDIPLDLNKDCTRLLNSLEAWSMYFTTGVADHEIAYGPCGPLFCGMVFRYYPVLLLARAGNSSGKFPNTVQLFTSWREQIEHEKDGIKLKALLQSLKDLQARKEKAPEKAPGLPPPLGTGV